MKGQTQLFSSTKQDWKTPRWLFDEINAQLNFDIDIAASAENRLCEKYTTNYMNSCFISGKMCWCNPPYNLINLFIKHAISCQHSVCFLVPSRTDTKWFHSLPSGTQVYLLKGRLKFGDSRASAPFPSCLILLNIATELKLSVPFIRFIVP